MSKRPEPRRTLTGEIRKDRAQVARMLRSSPFFGTGIHPTGNGGMESDDFDGDLDAGNPGTRGWAFNSLRVAIGELLLRPGSIGNDALANPVTPGVVNVRATGFALPVAYTEVASVDVTIPSGCTRVLANMTGWVQGYNVKTTGGNNTTGGDYVYARVKAGSSQSAANMPAGVSGNGGTSCATMGLGSLLTGLTPGGTLHFAVMGASDYVIAAHANNDALLTGTLVWLR